MIQFLSYNPAIVSTRPINNMTGFTFQLYNPYNYGTMTKLWTLKCGIFQSIWGVIFKFGHNIQETRSHLHTDFYQNQNVAFWDIKNRIFYFWKIPNLFIVFNSLELSFSKTLNFSKTMYFKTNSLYFLIHQNL